jgi:hypothetical protein
MKAWWLSKTLWVNFIALVAAILQAKFGFVLEPTTQVMILTTINLILRCVTKDPIGLQ